MPSILCSSTHRTLVFVNSVAAAEGVAALLAGIEMEDGGETLKVLQYHRGRPKGPIHCPSARVCVCVCVTVTVSAAMLEAQETKLLSLRPPFTGIPSAERKAAVEYVRT